MLTRLIVPAMMTAALLATPALAAGAIQLPNGGHLQLAASMTVPERCNLLEKRFDIAIKTHETAAKASEAKAMRIEGGNLCASGKHDLGVAKLQQALKLIGVESKV